MNVYLEAISGDCASGGLNINGDKILINPIHKKIVINFLKAQSVWLSEVCFTDLSKGLTKTGKIALDDFYNNAQKLEDVGIFNNKWQRRTTWRISTYINK